MAIRILILLLVLLLILLIGIAGCAGQPTKEPITLTVAKTPTFPFFTPTPEIWTPLPVETAAPCIATVATQFGVYVRSQPVINPDTVITAMPYESSGIAVERSGDWVRVEYPVVTGWVAGWLQEFTGDCEDINGVQFAIPWQS